MGSKTHSGKAAARASKIRSAAPAAFPKASPVKVTRTTTHTVDWAAIVGHVCRALVGIAVVIMWSPPDWAAAGILLSSLLPNDGFARLPRWAGGR